MSEDHRYVDDVAGALRDPVLVVMLTGWIDASGSAAAAMAALEEECRSHPLIEFDDDTYIDYRARRPTLELRDGVNTGLAWAVPQLQIGAVGGRDILTLSGPEPDMNWHRFATTVGQIAVELKVGRMVALGAYPFATPHTRPAHLSATSPSRQLLDALPFRTSSIDVPAGMAAALELALHERDIPAIGIWVQVPHYVATMSYPAASVALLDGLGTASGISVEAQGLRREALLHRERLDHLVEGNDEHRTMVAQFEELYDAADESVTTSTADDAPPGDGELELRSGDEIAAEVERYLRDRGKS